MPDLEAVSKAQCFPRYRYEPKIASSAFRGSDRPGGSRPSSPTTCPTSISSNSANVSPAGSIPHGGIFDEADLFPTRLERIDNVTDAALARFRTHYRDDAITKDAIFDYVYGILHAPGYRERFANDLSKALPRIPFAPDFHPFADAGRALMDLHLGYEDCEEYPLDVVFTHEGEPRPEHFRIGWRAMHFEDDERSVLIVNEYIHLAGIPPDAHEHEVNGRTPLEWFIDRYRVVQDKQSGILNDPNAWFDDPRALVTAFRRIVHVSVETVRIVRGLPDLSAEADRDSAQATSDLQAEAHRQALAVAHSAQAEEDQEFVDAISVRDHK